MQGMTPLAVAMGHLQQITLPPLTQPPVGKDDEPTEELIAWGIKYYAYSAIAHLRMVLQGVVLLANAEIAEPLRSNAIIVSVEATLGSVRFGSTVSGAVGVLS